MPATHRFRRAMAARVRHNLGIKLVSGVLAVFLWAFVHGSATIQRPVQVPIRYANLADSLMFDQPVPAELRVMASGPARDLLLHLGFGRNLEAVIDLSRARSQQFEIHPAVNNIALPPNSRIKLEQVIDPTVLSLHLAKRRERELPVRIVLQSGAPEGYVLVDSIRVEPAVVRVSGPAHEVETLSTATTAPVQLLRSRETYQTEVGLAFASGRITSVPERVSLRVPMARLRSRVLTEPVAVEQPLRHGLHATADADRAQVTVSGPEHAIEMLEPGVVRLWVDARHLAIGHHDSVVVQSDLPGWARVVQITPRTLGMRIERGGATPASPHDAVPLGAAPRRDRPR